MTIKADDWATGCFTVDLDDMTRLVQTVEERHQNALVYGRPTQCPSDEMLAAYVDGTALSAFERMQVSEHLNYCPRCYELVCEVREVQRVMHEDQESTKEEYRRLYLQEMRVERTKDD